MASGLHHQYKVYHFLHIHVLIFLILSFLHYLFKSILLIWTLTRTIHMLTHLFNILYEVLLIDILILELIHLLAIVFLSSHNLILLSLEVQFVIKLDIVIHPVYFATVCTLLTSARSQIELFLIFQ